MESEICGRLQKIIHLYIGPNCDSLWVFTCCSWHLEKQVSAKIQNFPVWMMACLLFSVAMYIVLLANCAVLELLLQRFSCCQIESIALQFISSIPILLLCDRWYMYKKNKHNKKDKYIYPKGFGFAWEQAHFTSRGHWETDVIAGTTIFKFAFSRNHEVTDDRWYSWSLLFLTLQILNVEKNRLTSLPPSIGELRLLQTLNLKGMMLTASCLWGREWSYGLKSLFFPHKCVCK